MLKKIRQYVHSIKGTRIKLKRGPNTMYMKYEVYIITCDYLDFKANKR